MKQKINLFLAAAIIFAVTFTSCKKNSTETDYATELSTHSQDQTRFSAESDAISDDVNNSIDNYNSFNGRVDGTAALPCNATVTVDSTSDPKKIIINYNGLNCQGTRTRVGTVIITLPQARRWKDAGAVITVSIQNLKITRVSDNKSITVNGTKTITNVNGGRLRDLATATSTAITHTIVGNSLTVTFDDGSQRIWNESKKRVFTYSGGLVITTTGTGVDGNLTGISEWGTNRFGNAFTTVITQPMVVKLDCSTTLRLVSGMVTHTKLVAASVVTFGLDASGNAVTACPTGSYYFKLVWTGINGVVRTVILPY